MLLGAVTRCLVVCRRLLSQRQLPALDTCPACPLAGLQLQLTPTM